MRTKVGITAAVLLLGAWVLTGCAMVGEEVLTPQLQDKLASERASADDHVAAALLYQQQGQRLEAEAARLEREAAAIGPTQDPRNFRRGHLIRLAQMYRERAAKAQELYASHQTQAQTMMGKQPPQ